MALFVLLVIVFIAVLIVVAMRGSYVAVSVPDYDDEVIVVGAPVYDDEVIIVDSGDYINDDFDDDF